MTLRTLLAVAVSLLMLSAVAVPACAQTYAELDAELAADKKAFWNRGIDRAVAAAGKAFDAGDHARAIAEANTVLLYAPDARGSLPLLRGRAHAAVHAANKTSIDLITARADFLANIPHLPADPWPHVYLAQLHAAGNHAFHAAHHFGKALEIDPDSYAALSGKAHYAYFVGDFTGCIDAVKRFMAHASYSAQDDGWSHFRLGECHASLGDKASALQHFEQAILAQPERRNSLLYRAFLKDGYTCRKLGRNEPDKPFDKFVAYLRNASCLDGGLGSLAAVLKDDPQLRGYGLLFENEFQRRLNYNTPVPEHLGPADADTFYREAKYLLEKSTRGKTEFDIASYNTILELLNHAIASEYVRSPDFLVKDLDVAAREMRAHLLIQHPDKRMRLRAWDDQIALSYVPREHYEGKPVYKNGADVKMRVIRGLVYAKAKDNHRAAIAEFDAAIALLAAGYRSRFDVDVPEFAEPHWRKGDALAALGEFGAAALAYAKALEIMPNSRNAQAGMQQLQQNPAASAAASQALQQASERIARDQAQAAVGQANALVAQYNDLVSRTLPDLQRQQQELERTVSAYMGRDAAGRAATHRSVYDACDRVIGRHDAFIMTLQGLQGLQGRAAAVPQLAAEIDSQIASLRSAVQRLQRVRLGVVEAL